MATRQPVCANCRAVAAPTPREAPVMRADLPESVISLFQFLEHQIAPTNLCADEILFPADAMHLQADEALGGEGVFEITRHAVKPGFDGIAPALDTHFIPLSGLVSFDTSGGELGRIAAVLAGKSQPRRPSS